MHGEKEVQPLGVGVDELGGDAQGVAFLERALIGDVGFEDVERVVGALPVRGADSETVEQHVARPIEDEHVIGDVHMSVIVDPIRWDGTAINV